VIDASSKFGMFGYHQSLPGDAFGVGHFGVVETILLGAIPAEFDEILERDRGQVDVGRASFAADEHDDLQQRRVIIEAGGGGSVGEVRACEAAGFPATGATILPSAASVSEYRRLAKW
jgi:hypothetical protein